MALPDFLTEDYSRYAFTGDEWLVSYAHLSSSFIVVYPATFSMAMVLELYLKAYAAKLAGSGVDVSRFGHRIADLYIDLQMSDHQFPTEALLNPALSKLPLHDLDSASWSSNWFLELPSDQQADIRSNYEIYMVMAYAADLKYGIAPALPKHRQRVISSAWTSHNRWLATFVKAVRKRIGHPVDQTADRIRMALMHPSLDETSKAYLSLVIQ